MFERVVSICLFCVFAIPLVINGQPMNQNRGMQDRGMRGDHQMAPSSINSECSEEQLMSYFPKKFVIDVLRKYNVPQEKIDKIQDDLAVRDPQIVPIIEGKAEKMNPNPLKDPKYREEAVKIFRETLFENFSEILKKHGVSDMRQIQTMLDDIQEMKAKQFSQCMEQFQEDGNESRY